MMVGRWYISGPKLIPVYKKQCGQRLALLLASVRISYYGVSVVLLPYYIEGCGDVEDTLRTLDRICYFNGFSTKVNSLSPYSTRYFDNANPFMLQLSTPPTPVCAMSMIRLVNFDLGTCGL